MTAVLPSRQDTLTAPPNVVEAGYHTLDHVSALLSVNIPESLDKLEHEAVAAQLLTAENRAYTDMFPVVEGIMRAANPDEVTVSDVNGAPLEQPSALKSIIKPTKTPELTMRSLTQRILINGSQHEVTLSLLDSSSLQRITGISASVDGVNLGEWHDSTEMRPITEFAKSIAKVKTPRLSDQDHVELLTSDRQERQFGQLIIEEEQIADDALAIILKNFGGRQPATDSPKYAEYGQTLQAYNSALAAIDTLRSRDANYARDIAKHENPLPTTPTSLSAQQSLNTRQFRLIRQLLPFGNAVELASAAMFQNRTPDELSEILLGATFHATEKVAPQIGKVSVYGTVSDGLLPELATAPVQDKFVFPPKKVSLRKASTETVPIPTFKSAAVDAAKFLAKSAVSTALRRKK